MDALLEALLNIVLEPLLSLLWVIIQVLLEVALEVLLPEILTPVFSFLVRVFMNLLLYGIAVPFSCVLLTPILLARALSGPGRYAEKVFSGYRAIREGVAHPRRWWR